MNVNAQYRLVRLVLMYGIIFYGFIRVSWSFNEGLNLMLIVRYRLGVGLRIGLVLTCRLIVSANQPYSRQRQ